MIRWPEFFKLDFKFQTLIFFLKLEMQSRYVLISTEMFTLTELSTTFCHIHLSLITIQRLICHKIQTNPNKQNKNYKYVVLSISFQTFLLLAFKIVVGSWKFCMLLLYILWDDWPTYMISGSNELLQQELEYTLLKPDCHSWWISKIQSGR